MTRLEFWPDYGGVLLHADGEPVALDTLGLSAELVTRARDWIGRYDDSRLDPAAWDEAWLDEGRALFGEFREALAASGFELVDWEGLWAAESRWPPDRREGA